ncbi:phage antirepressor KilAC domain-containing protein [Commensalibacter sp. Nvir]|uniref:phage antirepressor n=2 Tax=Commensalibacter sp. Nvir TaxID=3069817 RepID=UPI0030C7EAED
MSNIIPFQFENTEIRVVNQNAEAWFVGSDVAKALGYSKPRNAIAQHCKSAISIGALNQGALDPQTKIIPERDVYRLIMRSKLPSAEAFEEKVVGEILPSIRKTGGYMASIPDETPEQTLSRALLLAKDTMDRQKQEIAQLKPKAEALERIAVSDGSMCITNAAKDLQVRPKELFDYLIQNGWIYRRNGNATWLAYQKKIQQGLLEHKVTEISCDDGSQKIIEQAKVTRKGLAKLAELLNRKAA